MTLHATLAAEIDEIGVSGPTHFSIGPAGAKNGQAASAGAIGRPGIGIGGWTLVVILMIVIGSLMIGNPLANREQPDVQATQSTRNQGSDASNNEAIASPGVASATPHSEAAGSMPGAQSAAAVKPRVAARPKSKGTGQASSIPAEDQATPATESTNDLETLRRLKGRM